MYWLALRMLTGDRAKFVGIVVGVAFAALLTTLQLSIFAGIMTRTYGGITDVHGPDIWVMDRDARYFDEIPNLQDNQVLRVRSVAGVEWAVPFFKGLLHARLPDGRFQAVLVYGIDDSSLIGGPPEVTAGRLEDLRRPDAVLISERDAAGPLAARNPDGSTRPMVIGDEFQINDRRAVVVGLCRVSPSILGQPRVYSTLTRAKQFAPVERKLTSFVLAKAADGADPAEVAERISAATGLAARSKGEFQEMTFFYVLSKTGVATNFGIAVALAFLVGAAIAGQMFFTFVQENLRQFACLKAMGVGNPTLARMALLQAVTAGSVGFGLGVGGASLFGLAGSYGLLGALEFRMLWQIPVFSAVAVALIVLFSAVIALRQVMTLEPAVVFK